jgi:hypothetical protein
VKVAARPISLNHGVERWAPAHADLRWANLHGPDLLIVDWER